MHKKRTYVFKGLLLLGLLIGLNWLASHFFFRWDLTQDNRYTLSPAAKELIQQVDQPLIVDVFLAGDFPAEFRKLQQETRQMLEEFQAYNGKIQFNFVNPLEDEGDANEIATQFYQMGMTPARINVVENGRSSESLIFPWAMGNYGEKSVVIPLMRNQVGATTQERINNSVQHLEYALADAFSKLLYSKSKKIAVMRGNGELPDARIADFIRSIQEYYFVAPFTLDSVASSPQRTLDELLDYDLIIEAKPTQAFTEEEKFVLDQYLMNGGKALWLVDRVSMETDSLFNPTGAGFAFPMDLNLDDFFFKYGIRINPQLVKDLYSAPIILASGTGNNTSFNPYPWPYFPLSASLDDHPIINNIEAVRFEYANPIDTLQNTITKQVLLTSSPLSQIEGTPREVSLDQIQDKPDAQKYQHGPQTLGVLLEGEFSSVYQNRIKPFEYPGTLDRSSTTSMIVISDGDVVKNELQQGQPLELGFDRFTGATYGNKEFLVNAVNYLLDDRGLLEIRSKQMSIPFLDLRQVEEEKTYWQIFNLIGPLVVRSLIAGVYQLVRSRRYKSSTKG